MADVSALMLRLSDPQHVGQGINVACASHQTSLRVNGNIITVPPPVLLPPSFYMLQEGGLNDKRKAASRQAAVICPNGSEQSRCIVLASSSWTLERDSHVQASHHGWQVISAQYSLPMSCLVPICPRRTRLQLGARESQTASEGISAGLWLHGSELCLSLR